MESAIWILIDTETTGFNAPIFTVEIAAQKMKGWEKEGAPFRRLINQNRDIPPGATRVHGYTKEVLARDGHPPQRVYREFAEYVGGEYPIVAFNLDFDWDQVLTNEWARLGISPIGRRGFCAFRLARQLLDPCPAGNCKLQTLRQYYSLNGGNAHTALGDVETTLDLMRRVLRPIADSRGLNTWAAIERYAGKTFYPSVITFGKYKGRDFRMAKTDHELRSWLEWLANSGNGNAKMGIWYLRELGFNVSPVLRENPPPPQSIRNDIRSEKISRAVSNEGEPQNTSGFLQACGCLAVGLLVGTFGVFMLRAFAVHESSSPKVAPIRMNEKMDHPSPVSSPISFNSSLPKEPDKESANPNSARQPASIPTFFRTWKKRDGRQQVLKAVEVDYEKKIVFFRMLGGELGKPVDIGELIPEDQEFLLGYRLSN